MTTLQTQQNYIDHIALVLDASASMGHLEDAVIRTADKLIEHLAEQYKIKGRETRVSVYVFSGTVECTIWDMDVLRLPSMKDHYKNLRSNTALIDATFLALDDADLVTEKYGDHAFLVYVLTDGEENASRGNAGAHSRLGFGRRPLSELAAQMRDRLTGLKDNRTVGILVPDDTSYQHARQCGYDNIVLWDATTEKGLEEAVETIKTATDTFLQSRTTGLRSAKGTLFAGGNIDAKAIKAAGLRPLPNGDRQIVHVSKTDDAFQKPINKVTKTRLEPDLGWFVEIQKFVDKAHPPYRVGKAYYLLEKRERIQGDKAIAVMEKTTNKVYTGDAARQLLGLPEHVVSVKPDHNRDYDIFVQSSSVNRHLPIGTKILLLTK